MITREDLQAEWDRMSEGSRNGLLSWCANARPDYDFWPYLEPHRVGVEGWHAVAEVPGIGRFVYTPNPSPEVSAFQADPFGPDERHLWAVLIGTKIKVALLGQPIPPPPIECDDDDIDDVIPDLDE